MQKSGIFTKIKTPNTNGGLFSASVCTYFTPDSGTLSTAFLPCTVTIFELGGPFLSYMCGFLVNHTVQRVKMATANFYQV